MYFSRITSPFQRDRASNSFRTTAATRLPRRRQEPAYLQTRQADAPFPALLSVVLSSRDGPPDGNSFLATIRNLFLINNIILHRYAFYKHIKRSCIPLRIVQRTLSVMRSTLHHNQAFHRRYTPCSLCSMVCFKKIFIFQLFIIIMNIWLTARPYCRRNYAHISPKYGPSGDVLLKFLYISILYGLKTKATKNEEENTQYKHHRYPGNHTPEIIPSGALLRFLFTSRHSDIPMGG